MTKHMPRSGVNGKDMWRRDGRAGYGEGLGKGTGNWGRVIAGWRSELGPGGTAGLANGLTLCLCLCTVPHCVPWEPGWLRGLRHEHVRLLAVMCVCSVLLSQAALFCLVNNQAWLLGV